MPNNGSTRKWDMQRMIKSCKLRKATGCWIWQAACNVYGYGAVRIAGKTKAVHRLAYELANGVTLVGKVVMHSCDTPSCCNPEHLILGSHADNVKDKQEKGRQLRGSQIGNSKLSEDDVLAVRRDSGTNQKIADSFNISTASVSRIKNRVDWGWLQ
jgi:hypothetical protein